jgi:hypothetical protein
MWQVVKILKVVGKSEAMPRRVDVCKCSQSDFHVVTGAEPVVVASDMGPRFVAGLAKGDGGNQPADWNGVWFGSL